MVAKQPYGGFENHKKLSTLTNLHRISHSSWRIILQVGCPLQNRNETQLQIS
jgi:hypothetical protein